MQYRGRCKGFERAAKGLWKVENNLQTMKKIVMAVLNTVKASYRLSMKRIRYELSPDYENEAERLLSMLDIETVKESLGSKGKSPKK